MGRSLAKKGGKPSPKKLKAGQAQERENAGCEATGPRKPEYLTQAQGHPDDILGSINELAERVETRLDTTVGRGNNTDLPGGFQRV